jgi:hypothetical protein
VQFLSVAMMSERCQNQSDEPNGHEKYRKNTWCKHTYGSGVSARLFEVEELIDREAETDHRRGRSYPGHQRSLVRQPSAFHRQSIAIERVNLSRHVIPAEICIDLLPKVASTEIQILSHPLGMAVTVELSGGIDNFAVANPSRSSSRK